MNIAELLNINAEKFPTRPAIGFQKNNAWNDLDWKRFRILVFKIANALKNAGVQQGDRVAIFSENSAEWISFDLAILCVGAVTVPIYATNGREEVRYILEDADAKIILAGGQAQYDILIGLLAEGVDIQKIIISKKSVWQKDRIGIYLEDFIATMPETFEIASKNAENLATVIYTSGTSGEPKGVMLSHGNFRSTFRAHHEYFRFKNFEKEHSLAFLPLTHVFERAWTLLCLDGGAKVSFLEDPKAIADTLPQVRPTMMCSVPRFYQKIYAGIRGNINNGSKAIQKLFRWAMGVGARAAELRRKDRKLPPVLAMQKKLADALVFNKIKIKLGGKLRFLPCGGAAISPEITRFFDAIGIHIIAGYGLTETTATVAASPLTGYVHGTNGAAFGKTEIRIGEENEVQVKGENVMLGYWKKLEDTAAAFTPDGWFRTGDAGELDENGFLIITDRIKDLMKTSNGKYIAPQPIENQLTEDDFIEQIMLVAEGRPYLSALIVPNFPLLEKELASLNVEFTNWKEVLSNSVVNEFYEKKIGDLQAAASKVDKIKKFKLMPQEFSLETGEITPTLKIKRRILMKKYAQEIENLYK